VSEGRPPTAVVGWTAVALVLRLGLIGRGLPVLDRLFIPDDTWYTLSIARNLAAGLGPTADGLVLTSGFQPLLAWLQVPLFWCLPSPEAVVLATLVILSCADAAVAGLLGWLAAGAAGVRAGWAAAALWALSPFGVAHALGGLETSLALALSLALVLAWTGARSLRGWAGVGLLCGLCLLARIDTALLVGGLGLCALAQRRWAPLATAVAVALVVVAPWWGWCWAVLGSPVPESGPAVLAIVAGHRSEWLTTTTALAWATGNVVGAPSFDAVGLRGWLDLREGLAWVAAAGTGVALLGGGAWVARQAGQARVALLALTAHGAALFAFYGLHLQAVWFFRRYLAPTQVLATLVLAVAWARLGPGLAARAVLAVALTFGAMRIGLLAIVTPAGSFDAGHDGIKGYLGPAAQVWEALPGDAVVGGLQTGALSWTAPAGARVVNLDGVVDGASAQAFAEGSLARLARSRGVTHLADWTLNLEDIRDRWGEPLVLSSLEEVPLPGPLAPMPMRVVALPP